MLTQAWLLARYYGEAILYIAYLWNLSPSHPLPESKTPFEILHNKKSDLLHLCVFSTHCFACIPIELHTKNHPHFCVAIFLGYPDAIKGWHLHNIQTGTFFNAHDVIFNEGSVLHSQDESEVLQSIPPAPKVSSSPAVGISLGSGGVTSEEPTLSLLVINELSSSTKLSPSNPAPVEDQPGPCHSTQNCTLTEKGAKYAAEMCNQ